MEVSKHIYLNWYILGAILATSILALNPSTITNVGAQMYGDQYGYDRNYYQDDNRYGYDNNHPEKKNVNVQKIKCVNSNINVNGVDITKIPRDDIAGLAAANEAGEGPDGANTQNGNGLGDKINFDRNLVNVCVNVNDNEQTKVTPPGTPPEEETATLLVTKTVACEDNRDSGLSAQQELNLCTLVTTAIQESLFIIDVTDTDPVPTQFPGSVAGTSVTLGPGNYVVEETPNEAAIEAIIDDIEGLDGFQITGPVATFSPDCTQSDDFEATGSIAAGESETCNIVNTFQVVNNPDQGTCDDCFKPENEGGTLPPPRVEDLENYLADPDNIVPIGADADVNSIEELCDAIDAASDTSTPVTEDEIRDLLEAALTNPNAPPGQVTQVINCLLDLELITESP